MRNIFKSFVNRFRKRSNENGVTLLELVVAMGIILIMTVSGSTIYGQINKNARQAAVDKAVTDVLRSAMVFYSDGFENTQPEDARDQWMNSQGAGSPITVDLKIEDSEIVVTGSYAGKDISSTRSANPYGSTCIEGIYVGGKKTGQPCVTGEDEPEDSGPVISDVISRLTYKCDTTTSGYLALGDIQDGAKITMFGSDSSSKMVNYAPKQYINFHNSSFNNQITEKVTMKAGVKYSIVVNGKFHLLTTPVDSGSYNSSETLNDKELGECLISVDKLGADSGVTELRSFGAGKLVSVPDKIPSSVENLNYAFREARAFNDPNINKWDTSNINNMRYTFGIAKEFNQPLTNWDTSKVTDMYAMFYSIQKFDQDLSHFNTGNVENMGSMFSYDYGMTEKTDKGLKNWDTSNVKYMSSMFRNVKSNPDVSNWDTSKVTTFQTMFYNTPDFNRDITKWDTSNSTVMKQMFKLSKKFDKNISGWNVDKVTNYTEFNTDADLLTDSKIPAKFRS